MMGLDIVCREAPLWKVSLRIGGRSGIAAGHSPLNMKSAIRVCLTQLDQTFGDDRIYLNTCHAYIVYALTI
jgi:hypothetical protein